jgi:dTDP-4-amino-4,6-dideoxygalactose transaminase
MSGMIWRCDLVPQYEAHKAEIDQAIERVLRSGRYVLAENVGAFEQEFSDYLGVRHGVGVNSGTDALILALEGLGVGPGDEVITTAFTAIPTYAAICRAGARPVLTDIDPETLLMDLSQVASLLSQRTRAVVPVHLFGNAVDVERLREIVGSGVRIVEDCAQAHGATVRGRKVGSLGDAGAFSFYPTKNLGGYGDGGAVVTNDDDLARDLRSRRIYGMVNKDEFASDGINSRLDELQAAVLRVKLRHLDAMNGRRRQLAALYADLLPREHLCPQAVRDDVLPVVHVYAALCSGHRDDLVKFLEGRGIQSNVYYPKPLSDQEGYLRSFADRPDLPVARDVCKRIIALPFYPEMGEDLLNQVADGVQRFFVSHRQPGTSRDD